MHVADDADDRDLRLVDGEVRANRILIRPEPLRERRADDRDKRSIFAIAVGKDAAAQERNPHRTEVIGAGGPVVRARRHIRRNSGNVEAARTVAGRERQPTRRAGALDAGNRL